MNSSAADRYHHGDLREALMEMACRHIAEQGIEHLSLRALAREAGVSATAPYRHFPTRRCLLAALATRGFRGLQDHVEQAVAPFRERPAHAVFAAGMAYIAYARQHPVHYHLMFGGGIDDFSAYDDLREAADRSYLMIEGMVAEGVACGDLIQEPARGLMAAIWASVHGIASLLIDKPLPAPEGAEDALPALSAIDHLRRQPQLALLRLTRGIVRPGRVADLDAFVGEHWPV